MALLGNEFKDTNQTHVVRLWQAYKTVVAHNEISGSSLTSGAGRHALKLHGPQEVELVPEGSLGLVHRTQYVIVQLNTFGTSGPEPVGIGPQNSETDERLKDILVEKNNFLSNFGNSSGQLVQTSLSVWARYVTVRNNVFNGTGSEKYYTAINVSRRGLEPTPLGVRVLNNTIYKMDVPEGYSELSGFALAAEDANIVIKNNLIQYPVVPNRILINDPGATNTVQDHNVMTPDAGMIEPGNGDYRLAAGSLGVGAGTATLDSGSTPLPVFDDFLGNARTIPFDLGAYKYVASP
ncbi:MAG: hypothetical protein WC477_04125 [Patescibacteria group bacterium]